MPLGFFAFALALLLAPAAPAQISGASATSPASSLRPEDARVAAIAYQLGLAGTAYCPQLYPLTGLLLHHLPEYHGSARREMVALQLDRGPGVLAVVAESPAAHAGIVAGDVLLAVNGLGFPSPVAMAAIEERDEWRAAIAESEALLETELRKGPALLSLLREGREIALRLDPVPGCPARIRLARSAQTNAFATGRYVIATTALLGFVTSDDELAIAIGHELAHNILEHPAELDAQKVPRGFLRGFGKNAARVRATEEEADRLGLALVWAAGYDTGAAIPFWRRYYARFDRGPQLFRTHPSLRARERLIAETLAELAKSDQGAQRPELGKGALADR